MQKIFYKRFFLLLIIFMVNDIIRGQQADSTQNPFNVNVTYTGDLFSNVAGGMNTGTRYMDNVDVNLEVNLGALPIGLEGTTLYFYGLGNQGSSISSLAGDIQGISNIETDNSWRIYEIWAQKKFFLANSSILVGLYDINTEFNVLNSSLLFINSSHGIDPTLALSGVLGPSTFPYTSLAGRFKINPVGGLVFQFAVLDGVPSNPENPRGTKIFLRENDGLLLLAELGINSIHEDLQFRNRKARLRHFLQRDNTGENRYKFAIGAWSYTKKREAWEGAASPERDMGLYGLGEYKIFTEQESSNQGLSVFGRIGIANEVVNRFSGYLGAGLVYTGLFRGGDNDQAGLALAHAINSSDYNENLVDNGTAPVAETNIELTYLSPLSESVQLQGDLQYVINPGSLPYYDNALVVGARMILSF